jgi:hypothetical protein
VNITSYRSGKGIHLLIIISGQGEKLETKLGMQGENGEMKKLNML